MQIELEVVRTTNTKLQSQKSIVADDVSQLRAEGAQLQDQKKLLERQLSQNEAAAQEKTRLFISWSPNSTNWNPAPVEWEELEESVSEAERD